MKEGSEERQEEDDGERKRGQEERESIPLEHLHSGEESRNN